MASWMDAWIDKRVRVKTNGQLGTVVGCVSYTSDGQPQVERRELQVAMDSAGGSSFTHWRVEDCEEVKKNA